MSGEMVSFSRDDLSVFKGKYRQAVSDNRNSFSYRGKVYLTDYAKYVIEYLEDQFNSK